MRKKREIRKSLFFLFLLAALIPARGQVGVGKWREHLPFRMALQLEEAGDKLFCLTESGLFSYSQTDNRIVTYNKTNGLSDVGISTMAFYPSKQYLLLGYANGNIDILDDKGMITNIRDIKHAGLPGEKKINTVLFEANKALLGADFGIVAINLDKLEVADTYYIGEGGTSIRVNDIIRDESFYWVATEKGIFRAAITTPNLADFNNWEHLTNLPAHDRECTQILSLGQKTFIVQIISEAESKIIEYQNENWTEMVPVLPRVTTLSEKNGLLWVVAGGELRILDPNGIEQERLGSFSGETLDIRDALETVSGRRFLADNGRAVLEYSSTKIISSIHPEGPSTNKVSDMVALEKKLWAVPGGVDEGNAGKGTAAEINLFSSEQWTTYSGSNSVKLQGKKDLHTLAFNKQNNQQVYAGSWGDGIFAIEENGDIQQWNSSNSPLGNGEVRIAGMDTDATGNLWILDAGTTNAVKVKTPNDEWVSLRYPVLENLGTLRKILVTSIDDKWVLTGQGGVLFAFNENQTLSNNDDDAIRSFNVRDENGQILSSDIYDILEDKNENIWAGTDKGIMIYSQPGNALRDGDFFAFRPVISLGGQTQYLLETEQINCIAVNGANQKWVGTESSGVFLVSVTGDKQLLHFHTENSPLLSNRVIKIAVEPQSGEVFFATEKGIVSYRHTVTEGAEDFNRLYVYPNPVREDFDGDIVVTGLMSNSSVKVTDVSGNLVAEGRSSGGQFVWDGRNFSGSRVHTGVYLIFCANSDGSKSRVIKILFIQ